MRGERKTPRRRFKEFQNDEGWEQFKLKKILSENIKNGIKNRPGLNELSVRHINVVNMYTADKIHIEDLEFYDATQYDIERCDVEYGDVFVTRSSLKVDGIAEANVLLNSGRYVFDDHLMRLKLKHEYDPLFVKVLLGTKRLKIQFMTKAKTTTMTTIGQDGITSSYAFFPKYREQVLISSYFQKLDTLITLHQHKLEKLKSLKKAYLSQMFPSDGERKPKLRFAGFDDEWEQHKLGDITSSFSGGTPSVSNKAFYNGNIPFIRSGEIASDETELFISEDGLKNSSAKLVEQGDILYALYGATSGEVNISKISGAINQAILAIKPLYKYNSMFLMQWLRKEKTNIVGTYLQGGQGNLSGNIVKGLLIYIPKNKMEQEKIGSLFAKIDNLITLQQRKLEKLQNLKKAYLNEMFV